jgi:pyruvate dehydrogenase E1 component
VWSVTSFNELARDGQDTDRWNMLHPEEDKRLSFVERQLSASEGPVVAATDYMRLFSEQIRAYVPRTYRTLGTDGWGRSDSREKLRQFFEVSREYVCVAALSALADDGLIDRNKVAKAIAKLGVDAERPAALRR